MTTGRATLACLAIVGTGMLLADGAREAAWVLATGWLAFLRRVLPRVTAEPATIATGVGALLLLAAVLHLLGRSTYAPSGRDLPATWPWRWTLAAVALAVLLFAGGLSAVGLLRSTVWFAQEVAHSSAPSDSSASALLLPAEE
jgi:hypothetical protein